MRRSDMRTRSRGRWPRHRRALTARPVTPPGLLLDEMIGPWVAERLRLQGSTNMVTDDTGFAFQHLEYFPGGETWIHEKSDVHRTPHLFAGAYYDEFRQLYEMGQRWYEPREQMFLSVDPVLVDEPARVIRDRGCCRRTHMRRTTAAASPTVTGARRRTCRQPRVRSSPIATVRSARPRSRRSPRSRSGPPRTRARWAGRPPRSSRPRHPARSRRPWRPSRPSRHGPWSR